MDFLKCRLCNIKELPKKTKDRTDNTLYIYKGEPKLWKNGILLCIHNKRYTRCKECNLEGYKKTKELDKKQKIKHQEKIRQNKKEYREKNKDKIKQYREKNKDKMKEYHKEYYQENKDKDKIKQKNKEYREKNKDKLKEYREKNKDKIKEYYKEYHEKHKDKIRQNKKEYSEKNKDKMKEYRKNYKCEHNKTPQKCIICKPYSYLTELQRKRVIHLLNSKKDKHTTEYLGCDKKTLYNHLEKQFKDGMSWKNKGEWHIDHIRPCASFNLELEDERMKCFHYTNLQPLWASDNLSKSDKYDEKTHPLKWNGEKWIIK